MACFNKGMSGMTEKGILIVVSGFSGAGKGTLMKRLMSTHDEYALSISMTTRQPREGEKNGVEYFFTDRESFENTIKNDGLIEYAEYCGNYYGTPRAYVEEQLQAGKNVILEIEIQGALKVKKKFPETLLLFVTPPSAAELERRLKGRGTETDEVIARRLSRAYEESEGIEAYDYIVVNDDLDTCVEEIHGLVDAARRAPVRRTAFINEIREELKGFAKGEN
jgi:guanylate kinase